VGGFGSRLIRHDGCHGRRGVGAGAADVVGGAATRGLARRARRRPLPLWLALPAALAGGGALLASFPPYDLWWLAPVGVALMALAVHRRRALMGFALALVTGLTFFVPLISWTGLHVGALPWFLLAGDGGLLRRPHRRGRGASPAGSSTAGGGAGRC
jgi:hypothetical protein